MDPMLALVAEVRVVKVERAGMPDQEGFPYDYAQ